MTSVQLSDEEINEFKVEAIELLDLAERSLLALDKGEDFTTHYDAIFRAFHSVKGAAGMLNWTPLQHHMHQLENHFQSCKNLLTLSKDRVSYFLKGIDASRSILDLQQVDFKYDLPQEMVNSVSAEVSKKTAPQSNKSPQQQKDLNRPNDGIGRVPGSTSLVAPGSEKVCVFVLDDEKDIVEIISETLLDADFEVHGFTDADEALKQVVVQRPQAFFTDMNMPDLSGLDVLREVKKIDSDIPIIYVSAHLSKEILLESLAYGVYGAIEKPFSGKQIISIAKSATRKFQLWQLLNRTINLVMYQFSSLDSYLLAHDMSEVREVMIKELQVLLNTRRELRQSIKAQ